MGNPETSFQSAIAKHLTTRGLLVLRYVDKIGYPDLIGIPRGKKVLLEIPRDPIPSIVDSFFGYTKKVPEDYLRLKIDRTEIKYLSKKPKALGFKKDPNSGVVFWEVKQPGGRPEAHQEKVLKMLSAYGTVKVGSL